MLSNDTDIFGNIKETFDSLETFQFKPIRDNCETFQDLEDLSIVVSDCEANDEVSSKKRKRTCRAKKKGRNLDAEDVDFAVQVKRTRKKNDDNNDCCIIDISTPPRVARGRGRGNARQRRRKQTPRRGRSRHNNSLATYNVGDVSDYPDELENVPIFSTQSVKDVIKLDDSDDNEDEELSVKVEWQSIEIFKFTVRKHQSIKEIYDFFHKKYNVEHDNLLFMYNNEILRPEDTPNSIGYSEARFIDGGIVYKNKIKPQNNKETDKIVESGIKIKFQYQNSKHPYIVYVQNDEKLVLAMTKCAEKIEVPLSKLKFEFDGEVITRKQTPITLGLEGGECIDVKIMN